MLVNSLLLDKLSTCYENSNFVGLFKIPINGCSFSYTKIDKLFRGDINELEDLSNDHKCKLLGSVNKVIAL